MVWSHQGALLYSFSTAAVPNFHKLCDFKQHKRIIISQFCKSKVQCRFCQTKPEVSASCVSFWQLSGRGHFLLIQLLAVNWGPFPVSRDPCILWFVAPSSVFKSQPQQVLLTLQSSCLPSSFRLPVKDEWLDWTHPGNPKRSFYLRVFILNHICRASLSCKGIYSQVPGVEVWTSGRREVREYIILSTTTRKQFLKMRWTSRYW